MSTDPNVIERITMKCYEQNSSRSYCLGKTEKSQRRHEGPKLIYTELLKRRNFPF